MPPTPEFCVGDTNMLVSKICVTQRQTPDAKPKICVSPNAKPRRQSVEYRWRWVFWHWPCIFHVYFMYISCCLCTFFRVGNAKISRRQGRFQWNTGLTLKVALAPTQNLKFALAPTPTPDASQWNIGGVGPSGVGAVVGHVHFMFFVLISFAFCSQRKPSFLWNMGFRKLLIYVGQSR